MSDCKISEVSSRVCELGTKCCIVQHDGEMSDVNHQEAYEFAAFNRHNSNLARAYLDLRKQLEQANEAVRALSEGKPLGPIAGVHTIYNQAVEIKRLKEQLEQAEARCKQPFVHFHNGECWISEFDEHGTIRPLMGPFTAWKELAHALEATSPASPQEEGK